MLKENLSGSGGAGVIAQKLLSGTLVRLTTLILILAYFFFFLFYREKYEVFFLKIREENDSPEVNEVLGSIQKVAIN